MVADIRALTICSLGTVIQGSIADEAISPGQGLVRCRGQLILDGLQTPASGTVVELAYVRDGRVVRIPRKLRVISSFADPFRNQTTVQIGDKLVWLADKKPTATLRTEALRLPSDAEPGDEVPVNLAFPDPLSGDPLTPASIGYTYNGLCWQATELPDPTLPYLNPSNPNVGPSAQNPQRPADEELRAPVTIAAITIAKTCLAGLGLTSNGLEQLKNYYTREEARITGTFVQALENLFSSESYVGFLDANEVLQLKSLVLAAPEAAPQVTEDDIVDISPIGSGDIVPDEGDIQEVFDTGEAPVTPDEPEADPDPEPPTARSFLFGSVVQGNTVQISNTLLSANSTYDYYLYAFNRVTFAVSAQTGCSATQTATGVSVTADAEFEGTATLSFTVSDGVNTSNPAVISLRVTAPPPPPPASPLSPEDQEPPEPAEAPPQPKGGSSWSAVDGMCQTIPIPYIAPNGESSINYYESCPSTLTTEVYGEYGEILERWERQSAGGASAAANVYKLYLESGTSFKDDNVYIIRRTSFIYDYGFENTLYADPGETLDYPQPQAKYCTIGGVCQEPLDLPETPAIGDTFTYGECIYVWNGSRWVPSAEKGDGDETNQDPNIPLIGDVIATMQPTLVREIISTYEHGYYIAGAINWPDTGGEVLPPLPVGSDYLTEEQTNDYYRNESAGTSTTVQRIYKARYKTAEGQQYLAAIAENGQEPTEGFFNAIFRWSHYLLLDDQSTTVRRDLGYGNQFPPNSTATPTNRPEEPEGQGTTGGQASPTSPTEPGITGPTGSSPASPAPSPTPPLEPTMPKTWTPEDGYTESREAWQEENAVSQRTRYNQAALAVAYGNRYGVSLQVVPWVLPLYPLSPLYLNMRSVTGAYLANGITIAFNSDGILANTDALLVGGVGGTGTPWFPLPAGVTLAPAPEPTINEGAVPANSIETPEDFDPNAPGDIWSELPTDETPVYPIELEPEYIVPPSLPRVGVNMGVRVGMDFKRFGYSLTPVVKDQAVGIALGLSARRENGVKVPSTVTELLALNPSVSTGYAAQLGAAAVTTAAVAPRVASSYAAQVPAASITVAAAPGPIVPREALRLFAPVAGIAIGAVPPVLSTGVGVAVPAAVVAVNGVVPRAGGNLGDNYGLTALFEDDLLALL